jgi:hypothetical protein
MAVERAYLEAITGIRPASLPLHHVSAGRFREIVEYFALLFSRRPTWQSRHIPARYFVDLRLALRYFHTPGVAEAQLPFFAWKWRYAVMYCVATAILGFPELQGGIGSMHSQNSKADPFCDLLYLISFEQQREIVHASHGWPEVMQHRLWRAVQRVEGRRWNSPNSLRFKCQSQSSH